MLQLFLAAIMGIGIYLYQFLLYKMIVGMSRTFLFFDIGGICGTLCDRYNIECLFSSYGWQASHVLNLHPRK